MKYMYEIHPENGSLKRHYMIWYDMIWVCVYQCEASDMPVPRISPSRRPSMKQRTTNFNQLSITNFDPRKSPRPQGSLKFQPNKIAGQCEVFDHPGEVHRAPILGNPVPWRCYGAFLGWFPSTFERCPRISLLISRWRPSSNQTWQWKIIQLQMIFQFKPQFVVPAFSSQPRLTIPSGKHLRNYGKIHHF